MALGLDRAAQPIGGLEEHEIHGSLALARPLDHAVSGREPRDARPDDGHLHGRTGAIRYASPGDEVRQHGDEGRVVVGRRRAVKGEPERLRELPRLDVEVVQHLHVIADEADGSDDHVPDVLSREQAQHVADVGLEPRLAR